MIFIGSQDLSIPAGIAADKDGFKISTKYLLQLSNLDQRRSPDSAEPCIVWLSLTTFQYLLFGGWLVGNKNLEYVLSNI